MNENDVKVYLENLYHWIKDNLHTMDETGKKYYGKILEDIKGEHTE